MKISKNIKSAFLIILISGFISAPLTLISPSEASSAFWLGVSRGRLAIAALQLFLLLLITCLFILWLNSKIPSAFLTRCIKLLTTPSHYAVIRNILFGAALFVTFAFLYFSVFIPQALSPVSGWAAFSCWVLHALYIRLVPAPADFQAFRLAALFPVWKSLSTVQKRTTLVVLVLGLVYFGLFFAYNRPGVNLLSDINLDEQVMYPVVVKMLSTQPNIRLFCYQLFNYGAYIYGFPFFGLSAAVVAPMKLILKEGFADQVQINITLMRQFVNVLPSVLACFLFTYLATHFKKFWASIVLFLLLLTLPGVISVNRSFWHPDPLNLFFIALTLYYLDRDRLKFGANFYFAAIACGLSVATRLFGLFFFLAIASLIAAGLLKKVLSIRKAILSGLLFILLMGGVILAANPYSFSPGELGAAQRTFARQQETIAQGINQPDPEGIYQTGIKPWWPFITGQYGYGTDGVVIFMGVSVLAGLLGCCRKNYYLILTAWLLAIGTYLIGFVAVKSIWYLMPFTVPLYCGALAIPENVACLLEKSSIKPGGRAVLNVSASILFFTLTLFQLAKNLFEIALAVLH